MQFLLPAGFLVFAIAHDILRMKIKGMYRQIRQGFRQADKTES